MTDQVPRCGQVVRANSLDFPLLHAVLAKVAHARLKSLLNGDGRMRLRNSDERDFFRAASCPSCSSSNSFLDPKQVLANGGLRHVPIRIVTCVALQRGLSPVRLISTAVRYMVNSKCGLEEN